MKKVVVYKSKTGYTKEYAQWIAEELNCDLLENTDLKVDVLLQYDVIIYGGGMYAGGINGLNLIKKNMEKLVGKHIIVWATGANPGRKEEMDAVWDRHFDKEQQKRVKTYYLRGGFDYEKLGKADKFLMNLLKAKLEREKNPSEDEKGMLHAYQVPENHCKKENIIPLLEYVGSLQ